MADTQHINDLAKKALEGTARASAERAVMDLLEIALELNGGVLREAQSWLTPMEHLPARMFGDPDDMPRCVGCHFLLTPRSGHQRDCLVGAYIVFLGGHSPVGPDFGFVEDTPE